MNIGIIGVGVVGGAVRYGMEKLGHRVFIYDPIIANSKFEDILNTNICFICVPSPSLENGKCDTSIVEQTIEKLNSLSYKGIAAIKSTVSPGTTQSLKDKYFHTMKICFIPEFLRERCAITDFTENHDVCIIGTIIK
jgi:UDPglucose 6-dehydrogenase